MSDVLYVDESNFDSEVINSSIPVLVDFSATWCGPCQRQLPLLEKFATENLTKVKVVKVDIDDSPKIASKLGVRGVPTLMLFNGGASLGSKVGLTTVAEMNNFIMTKIGS